jgi:hypothetical protein
MSNLPDWPEQSTSPLPSMYYEDMLEDLLSDKVSRGGSAIRQPLAVFRPVVIEFEPYQEPAVPTDLLGVVGIGQNVSGEYQLERYLLDPSID